MASSTSERLESMGISCRSVLYSPGAKWVKISDVVVANFGAGKGMNKS